MSSKRSRAIRSSSQREFGLFNKVMPIQSPVELFAWKHPALAPISGLKPLKKDSKEPALAEKNQACCRSRTVVFTLGSPEAEKCKKRKQPDEGFGEFLKTCSLCKKKVPEDQDLYLYGYLGAFCSLECRDDQMALDGFDEERRKSLHRRCRQGGISLLGLKN